MSKLRTDFSFLSHILHMQIIQEKPKSCCSGDFFRKNIIPIHRYVNLIADPAEARGWLLFITLCPKKERAHKELKGWSVGYSSLGLPESL